MNNKFSFIYVIFFSFLLMFMLLGSYKSTYSKEIMNIKNNINACEGIGGSDLNFLDSKNTTTIKDLSDYPCYTSPPWEGYYYGVLVYCPGGMVCCPPNTYPKSCQDAHPISPTNSPSNIICVPPSCDCQNY